MSSAFNVRFSWRFRWWAHPLLAVWIPLARWRIVRRPTQADIRRMIVLTLGAILLAACGWNAATMNPESREYPCGTRGVVCGGSYPHASCCWQGDVCGGVDPACPPGFCCWVGEDDGELGVSQTPHVRQRQQWTQ